MALVTVLLRFAFGHKIKSVLDTVSTGQFVFAGAEAKLQTKATRNGSQQVVTAEMRRCFFASPQQVLKRRHLEKNNKLFLFEAPPRGYSEKKDGHRFGQRHACAFFDPKSSMSLGCLKLLSPFWYLKGIQTVFLGHRPTAWRSLGDSS